MEGDHFMDRMLVVVFDGESKAYEGKTALLELEREGSISVYGYAILAKSADGKTTVKQGDEVGPLGALTGTALGSLIGLLGGPVGVALGTQPRDLGPEPQWICTMPELAATSSMMSAKCYSQSGSRL